jgi:NAD(P)-dependent dehydrogenase (short-subunit alcohol dehydrogenase family)
MTAMLEVTMGKAGKEGSVESQDSPILKEVGLRRMAFSQEQANVISFLLSHESTYINGEYIVVDGGYNCIR